jgi:hypothetical protein
MTPKRPRDSNQLAKSIIDIATGKKPDRDPRPEEQGKDPAAVAMGKKGGAARAAVTLNDQAVAVVLDFMDPVRPGWDLDRSGRTRMLIRPEASSAQNIIATVSADGSTVWVLFRRLNSSCNRSIALVVPTPLARRRASRNILRGFGNPFQNAGRNPSSYPDPAWRRQIYSRNPRRIESIRGETK